MNKDKENIFLYKEYVYETLNKQEVERHTDYLIFPHLCTGRIYFDSTGIISNPDITDNLINLLNKLKEGFKAYVLKRGYNFNDYGWRYIDDEWLLTFIVEWIDNYTKRKGI